jgi:SAM-dependent methyltransferase
MSTNQPQIDFWNGAAALRWVTEQERLDRAFLPIDEVGFRQAAAQPGERVIDLGCGCGATTVALAERVGPTGKVRGIDISSPMLARARERARPFSWVDFVEGDAAEHRFAGDADLVYSRFGSMFFADPVAAFANIKRALVDGGRVALAVWRTPDDNPWHALPLRAAIAVLDDKPAPTSPDAPGPMSFANPDRLRSVLTSAGFHDVDLRRFDFSVQFSSTGVDDAIEFALEAGSVARVVGGVSDAVRARVRDAVRPVLAKEMRGDTIAMRASIWLAHAIT